MAGVWAKTDALLPMHPKCMRAGFWGTTIFFHLILLNRAHGCRGMISPLFADPAYLARYLQIDRAVRENPDVTPCHAGHALPVTGHTHSDAEEIVRHGLRSAEAAELIQITLEGVQIIGWDSSWDYKMSDDPERTRERKRRSREKSKNGADLADTPEDGHTGHTGHALPVTDPPMSQVTPRVEESRIDKNSIGVSTCPGIPEGGPRDATPAKAVKKPRAGLDPAKIPERAHVAAQVLGDYVRENHQGGTLAKMPPPKRQAAMLRWADVIRLMHTQDKHSWSEIDGMIHWCQRERFWRGNVQSAEGLRKHWDTMNGQRNRPGNSSSGGGGGLSAEDIAAMAHAEPEEAR